MYSPLGEVPLTIKPGGEYVCLCVKRHSPQPSILHSHHVWPLGEGGPNIRGNLLWLCLPGEALVTMADGTALPIRDARVGDVVFGHDGLPHHVTGIKVSSSEEGIVRLDDLLLTADHLVLTRMGWLPAGCLREGDEVCRLETFGERVEPHVFSLVEAQPQVLGPVVVRDQVDVVDDLGSGEPTTDGVLHDETCPLRRPSLVAVPYDEDHVPLAVKPSSALALGGTGGALEGFDTTVVAAELRRSGTAAVDLRGEGSAAPEADPLGGATAAVVARAGTGTGGVSRGQRRRHLEVFAAGGARLRRQANVAAHQRRWDALKHVERTPHAGYLYDITISGSRSFIAEGMAVHNCPTTHMNVHELWRLMDKLAGEVPAAQMRPFSRYVREVVKRGWDQKRAATP